MSTRVELWEKLCIWNQSVSGSKAELRNALLSIWRRKDLIQQYTPLNKENQWTMDPLAQILEKLSYIDHHLANLTGKVDQQQEHQADQQQEYVATQ